MALLSDLTLSLDSVGIFLLAPSAFATSPSRLVWSTWAEVHLFFEDIITSILSKFLFDSKKLIILSDTVSTTE